MLQRLYRRENFAEPERGRRSVRLLVLRSPGESKKRTARRTVIDHYLESIFPLGLYQHAAQHGAGLACRGNVVTLFAPSQLAAVDRISAYRNRAVLHAP